MTKNIDMLKVNEEMRSIGKSPAFEGTDFDQRILGEIIRLKSDATLEILKAFELGRRSAVRERRASNSQQNEKDIGGLNGLAFDLDGEVGGIHCAVITLEDVSTLLGHLREDMDNVKSEDVRSYFIEFHRSVRVLNELTRHSVDELNKHFRKTYEIKEAICNKFRHTKSPTSRQ